jgi:hypothetical protein
VLVCHKPTGAVDVLRRQTQGGRLQKRRVLFTRGKKTQAKDENSAKQAELFQQYCVAEA